MYNEQFDDDEEQSSGLFVFSPAKHNQSSRRDKEHCE